MTRWAGNSNPELRIARAHAVAAFADAGVGQADHRETGKPERDVHFDVDRAGLDAEDGGRPKAGEHRLRDGASRVALDPFLCFQAVGARADREVGESCHVAACTSVQKAAPLGQWAIDADILTALCFTPSSGTRSCAATTTRRSVAQARRPAATEIQEIHMLDAFQSIAGGKGKQVQKQTDELQLLIATAREERSALSAMLTTLTARSAKLTPLGKSLEQVTEKATSAGAKLDELTKRISALDDRARELEDIDKRIQALKDAAKQAEQTTQKAIGPDGELQKHREAVQHLSSQALQTQATLDTLKKERAVLDELRGHLRDAESEVKQALDTGVHAQGRARSDSGDAPRR